jgi:Na+/H+ antiporter NhaB
MVHGLGVLFILVGGFGMLARLGLVSAMPGWIIAKLVIWVLVASAAGWVYRGAGVARAFLLALPFIALLAAFFALYKPF